MSKGKQAGETCGVVLPGSDAISCSGSSYPTIPERKPQDQEKDNAAWDKIMAAVHGDGGLVAHYQAAALIAHLCIRHGLAPPGWLKISAHVERAHPCYWSFEIDHALMAEGRKQMEASYRRAAKARKEFYKSDAYKAEREAAQEKWAQEHYGQPWSEYLAHHTAA